MKNKDLIVGVLKIVLLLVAIILVYPNTPIILEIRKRKLSMISS